VDFKLYQLRTQPLEQMLPRLLDRIYGAGDAKAVVLLGSIERAQQLDRQLWTFSTNSFLPHCLIDDPLAAKAPILLTTQLANPNHAHLLVVCDEQDLLPQLPAIQAANFTQLVEIWEHHQAEQLPAKLASYHQHHLTPTLYQQQANGSWQEG
jgi:DNA polymerase-3 subunit chi